VFRSASVSVQKGTCSLVLNRESAQWLGGSVEDTPDYRHAGIDLFLASDHQGRGLGPEEIHLVAPYLFEVRGHHRLTIDPAAENLRAIHAYERVGFRPGGIMRQYERGRDGTWHDGLLMDLLVGELREPYAGRRRGSFRYPRRPVPGGTPGQPLARTVANVAP
jgi:RimJ/RimL family protein N-acetyltransferase